MVRVLTGDYLDITQESALRRLLDWADALTDLQHALVIAKPDPTTAIWVAAGTYRPTVGSDRASAVLDGFTIRGGNANHYAGEPSDARNVLGGGLYATGSPTFATLRVEDCMAGNGGGMYIGGGAPTLTGVTFAGNTAASGGAIWTIGSATVANGVPWGDSPNEVVGAYGGSASVNHSIVQMPSPSDPPYPGTGDLNGDPVLTGDLHLTGGSPAIDAGDNAAAGLSGVTTDLDGNDRFVDGDDDGTTTVDMGAYEYQGPAFTVTYVGNGSTGGSVPVDGTAYLAGQTVTVWGNTGGLVRTGYAFAGWNTAANGSGPPTTAAPPSPWAPAT